MLSHLPQLPRGPQRLQGPQEQKWVRAWGEKMGLCRAHQPHLTKAGGSPLVPPRVCGLWALSGQSSLCPLPGPVAWPPAVLRRASAHSLGDAQASRFSGGGLEVGAMPREQERGSRPQGQARSTDLQGAALRVLSQPTPIHGPPSLACSAWQGPRVAPCSASPALLPRPLGRPTQADHPQPWPSLACSSPQHRAGWLDEDPTGTPAPGKAGFTLALEKELCPQTRSQVNARAGVGWGGAALGGCLRPALRFGKGRGL